MNLKIISYKNKKLRINYMLRNIKYEVIIAQIYQKA